MGKKFRLNLLEEDRNNSHLNLNSKLENSRLKDRMKRMVLGGKSCLLKGYTKDTYDKKFSKVGM